MTLPLLDRIERVETEAKRRLGVADAATPGPWNAGDIQAQNDLIDADCEAIAAARTEHPQALRAILAVMQILAGTLQGASYLENLGDTLGAARERESVADMLEVIERELGMAPHEPVRDTLKRLGMPIKPSMEEIDRITGKRLGPEEG